MLSPSRSSKTLKQIGLAFSMALLGSSTLVSAAQALPSWLKLDQLGEQLGRQIDPQSTEASDTSDTRTGRTPDIAQRTDSRQSSPSDSPQNSPDARTAPQSLDDIRFSCASVNGQPTVMYNPQSQPNQYYPWATPTALGGGWSPERRCDEISRRLEFYRPDGLLELQTGLENGYNTICVTTEAVSSCRIVLTVPPGQNPVAIRDRIFNNLLVADSGEQTTPVVAYQDNGDGILSQIGQAIGVDLSGISGGSRTSSPSSINLRPFLDSADGGTGTRLNNSGTAPSQIPRQTPSQPGAPRLNPGNFR